MQTICDDLIQPRSRFIKFFENYAKLMNEVCPALRRSSLRIIWSRGKPAPRKLISDITAFGSSGQCPRNPRRARAETNQSLLNRVAFVAVRHLRVQGTPQSNLRFRISGLRCRSRPISDALP